jgi:hypothetical protein
MSPPDHIAIVLENARYTKKRARPSACKPIFHRLRDSARPVAHGLREVPGLSSPPYCSGAEPAETSPISPYGKGRLAMVPRRVRKGTAAALFACRAIGTFAHIVEHPCPPAEMLTMLNTRLHAVLR